MTPEQKLEWAIESYVRATKDEHELPVGEFKVVIMNQADKSDPLNQLLSIGAKLKADNGKIYTWRGTASLDQNTWSEGVKEAVKQLLEDIKAHPFEDVEARDRREYPDFFR